MGSSAAKPDANNNRSGQKNATEIAHEGNGPYKPYTEFPDIRLMRQAQLDYKDSTYKIQTDDQGIPVAFPTIKSRQQVFDEHDFSRIDSHAEKAAPKLSRDAGRLISYLFQVTKDDVEKVRAIFAWISSRDWSNTLPELDKDSPEDGTPLYYLREIMSASTSQYNPLFSLLCKEAGIPHKQITGYIRASAKELGEAPLSRGTYFMVYVDENWRFVHPHWGSCYVKNIRTKSDWELVEGIDGYKRGLASTVRPDILGFDREDFWFFVDPEVMAYFFLSEQAENQLLPRPIDQEEYRQMARLYQPFFLAGCKSISPAKCRLDAEESVIIEIGLPDDDSMSYNYGIFKRAIDPDWKGSKDFRRFVFMDRIGGKLRIRFDMPHIGVYKFEVSSQTSSSASNSRTLCEYLIDNKMPNFAGRPYPENDLNEWGIAEKGRQLGLEPKTEGGLVEARDGQAVITFKESQRARTALISCKLEDEKGNSSKLSDYVRQAKDIDESSIIIKTPKYGRYVLKVQGKYSGERDMKTLANYLVVSDRGAADDSSFPKAHHGQIGILGNLDQPSLEPISHKQAVIENVEEGLLEITMKERGDLDITAALIKDAEIKEENVYHYKIGDKRVFVLHLPSAGVYSFTIQARETGSDSTYRPVYNYVIISNEPKPNCRPFPQILERWRSYFIIMEPRDGLLNQKTKQNFRFHIPGAESVILIKGQEKIVLTKKQGNSSNADYSQNYDNDKETNDSSDIWETELDTGVTAEDIVLVVKLKDAESPEEVLKYKVMSPEEEQAIRRAQKQAELEAEERMKKIRQKAANEEMEAERRKKAKEMKVRVEQEEFKKNKEKYLEKQRKLEEEAKKKESNAFEMKEFKGREEKNEDKWKDLQNKITREMHMERLREAIRSKNRSRLETAINQATNNGINEDEELLKKARTELDIAALKEELRLAMAKKDATEIEESINKISSNNYSYSRLQQDVTEAIKLLERLKKIKSMKVDHLEMNSALFGELRRYNQPPEIVHRVIQAALLLFKKDEELTENWKTCQQFLNPSGPKSMNRKILDFDPGSVHPEIAARSREIFKQYELEKVQEVSPAAATIYVWALGAAESLVPEGSNIVPASVNRQCELFGYPKKSPTKGYDYRFSMRKPNSGQST